MAILTSRMLLRAKLITENAAHGDFPSQKPRLLPRFDYENIYRRVLLSWAEVWEDEADGAE